MSAISVNKAKNMARDHAEFYTQHAEVPYIPVVDIELEDEDQISFQWKTKQGKFVSLWLPQQRLKQLLCTIARDPHQMTQEQKKEQINASLNLKRDPA